MWSVEKYHCGGRMQGLHRQVDARRNHASLAAAIPPDHVQRDGGPAVDDDGKCEKCL
jgi:hypothetical protein